MSAVFVTGTDTEVGKTRISTGLIALMQQKGLSVAGMKPIASGCKMTPTGLQNDDALALIQQANVDLPYQMVNPYAFALPIAPHIAAEQAEVEVSLAVIRQQFEAISNQADFVVVEGAGGWLVPINKQYTMADLAVTLDLPVVLVVGIRLGCINHALLTAQAIAASGCKLVGWVANFVEENAQAEPIIATIKQYIDAPCIGIIPHLEDKANASAYLNDWR